MSQVTDRTVGANPTGFDMRTELNNIIAALESDNSGSSEPLNQVAGMKWMDTSDATYYYYKERNHDNTAWVTLFRYTVATKVMEVVSNGVVLQDSAVVHKTGDETITGVKTFSSNTIFNGKVGIGIGSPTFNLDIINTQTTGTPTDNAVLQLKSSNRNCAMQLDTIGGPYEGTINNSVNGTVISKLKFDSIGNILSVMPNGGLGYGTGSGGTVTQLTSKSTAVTLSKPCGQIIMNNSALASNTAVKFTLTNSTISSDNLIVVNIVGGVTGFENYNIWGTTYVGGATITVKNIVAYSLSEAIVIKFAIIKGAIA